MRSASRNRGSTLMQAMLMAAALHVTGALGAGAPGPFDGPLPLPPAAPVPTVSKTGMATISRDRLEGHTTASGEQYNRNGLNAAHRNLPFGSMVRVTNVKNQRAVVVRINDRGPGAGNAIIDLTPRAAAMIGLHGISTGEVRLEVIGAARSVAPNLDDLRNTRVK